MNNDHTKNRLTYLAHIILITKAKVWKALATCMNTIAEEIPITITKDGIESSVMDPSHASMINFKCDLKYFEEIKVEKEVETEIVLFSKLLLDIVKRFSDDTILNFEINTKTKNVKIIPTPSNVYKKSFEMRTVESSASPKNSMPNVVGEVKKQIPLTNLTEMIEDCKVVNADFVWFETKNNTLIYEGKGDTGKAHGDLLDGITQPLKASTGFGLGFLGPFLNSISKFSNSEIYIDLASSKPLLLTCLCEDIGLVKYFLAPRVVD